MTGIVLNIKVYYVEFMYWATNSTITTHAETLDKSCCGKKNRAAE
jgi:hypothetical protein